MASARHGTLYTGVTSHLIQRICQHRGGSFDGFTKRYGVKTLVWFEPAGTMHAAITREKQIKNWQRKWKIELIEPAFRDHHAAGRGAASNPATTVRLFGGAAHHAPPRTRLPYSPSCVSSLK